MGERILQKCCGFGWRGFLHQPFGNYWCCPLKPSIEQCYSTLRLPTENRKQSNGSVVATKPDEIDEEMPFYQQIIVALPKYPKEGLVAICRKHAKTIIDNGGLVRGIENHGVRPLSERARRSVTTKLFR